MAFSRSIPVEDPSSDLNSNSPDTNNHTPSKAYGILTHIAVVKPGRPCISIPHQSPYIDLHRPFSTTPRKSLLGSTDSDRPLWILWLHPFWGIDGHRARRCRAEVDRSGVLVTQQWIGATSRRSLRARAYDGGRVFVRTSQCGWGWSGPVEAELSQCGT